MQQTSKQRWPRRREPCKGDCIPYKCENIAIIGSVRSQDRRCMDLIGVQRWRGKRMLREVRALALLLPLRRLAGSIPSFVSIRLLEPLFVPRLESTGEVQTSKFGEKRHHFCGARLRGAEASTPFQWHRCANSRRIDSRQTALLSLLLPRPPWPPKPSSARVRRHRRQAATRDECLPVRVAQLLQWRRRLHGASPEWSSCVCAFIGPLGGVMRVLNRFSTVFQNSVFAFFQVC